GRRDRARNALRGVVGEQRYPCAAFARATRQPFPYRSPGWQPASRSGWEVGAATEGLEVGGEEGVERPASTAAHLLHPRHINRVDVGSLLTVDLDGDEVVVHQLRHVGILERLSLHDVAPVTGAVANRDQYRPVLTTRQRQ